MDEGQPQDVNQTPDVNTGSAPSDTQQTPTVDPVENQDTGITEDPKVVPYDRFAEVNTKARTYESENLQLKAKVEAYEKMRSQPSAPQQPQPLTPEQQQRELAKQALGPLLKELAPELGFMTKEESLRQQRDQQMNQTMSNLEKTYNGSDGRPKFDRKAVVDFAIANHIGNPEVAYKTMNEAALLNWHVQQAVQKSKGLQTEGSNGSGSQNVGTTNDDLKTAIAKGDKNALHTLLKRSMAAASK